MKVLVPIDGSDAAERAVRFVAQLTRDPARIEVVLLNVQPAPSDVATLHMGHQAILEHLRTRGEDVIGAARKALDAAGIRNEARVEIAPDPATEIARVAGEARCDQIVMGTRGLGALAGLALGSVATKVLHLVEIPVTLVR